MNANVGSLDRQMRITGGVILIALVLTGVLGPWGWIGVIPIATGVFNFCPLYSLIGVNSCSIEGIETNVDGWSPYVAGALVGLLAIASVYLTTVYMGKSTYLGASTNFLAEKSKLKLIEKPVCLLNVDKDESPKNGRFSVHFYKDAEELKACVFHQHCESARNVSLVLKNQLVFRSYFLSDFKREKFYQHCVTPEGNWIANTTCYTVEN